MTEESPAGVPTIVPYFSYRDATAALVWLDQAFGFEKTTELLDDDGVVVHAEMTFGGGAIMVGTATAEQRGQSLPDIPTGPGIYVVVPDVDAHHARAEAAGATIVYPPEETEFGTRRYRAKDLEGFEWSFGTYQPSSRW